MAKSSVVMNILTFMLVAAIGAAALGKCAEGAL
jgi:hypothetical protein